MNSLDSISSMFHRKHVAITVISIRSLRLRQVETKPTVLIVSDSETDTELWSDFIQATQKLAALQMELERGMR